jgi:cyclophilin family peptidyl-prolyl cis-trans isomerase
MDYTPTTKRIHDFVYPSQYYTVYGQVIDNLDVIDVKLSQTQRPVRPPDGRHRNESDRWKECEEKRLLQCNGWSVGQ